MNTKEPAIMNQTCLSIIGMDWRIKFVGIVDQNGKLLIGKGRSNSSDGITDEIIFDTSSNITNSMMFTSSIGTCIYSIPIIFCGLYKS
jgi:hypothetical protein